MNCKKLLRRDVRDVSNYFHFHLSANLLHRNTTILSNILYFKFSSANFWCPFKSTSISSNTLVFRFWINPSWTVGSSVRSTYFLFTQVSSEKTELLVYVRRRDKQTLHGFETLVLEEIYWDVRNYSAVKHSWQNWLVFKGFPSWLERFPPFKTNSLIK